VRNSAYLAIEYEPLYVSESSVLPDYKLRSRPYEWTDEEITSIRTVLRKLTATRITNSNDAEDLVQDTLLTMIAKHPGSDLEKGTLAWSLGILRRKLGNYYRKAQRYTSLSEQESHAQQLKHQSRFGFSPELKVFHEELQWIVGEKLAQLPSSQRQAIELLISGLNTGEVVEQLHPERYQNVINRLFRARQKLAKELAKYGYGPNAKTGLHGLKRCRGKK
jgi:RNA polymerase sigma factor (sigma-70 family)